MSGSVCFSYAGYYRQPDPVPEHRHCGTELVYVVRGSCVNSIEGQLHPCRAGDICLIPAEARHAQLENSGDLHTQYVVFNDSGRERKLFPQVIHAAEDRLIRHWFGDITTLFGGNAVSDADLLLELLWRRIRQLAASAVRLHAWHPALVQALRYLNGHYREPVSVRELAGAAGVSATYLNRLFRETFSMSPARCLAEIRMQHARQLLMNRYYQIAQVARLAGYDDPDYFCRRFKEIHGVTPLTYRRYPSRYSDSGESRKHLFIVADQELDSV